VTASRLQWVPAADPQQLAADGWHVIAFSQLRQLAADADRASSQQRVSLLAPCEQQLAQLVSRPRIAVIEVTLNTLDDLKVLHGYLLEPLWRADSRLLIHSPQKLTQLDAAKFSDPDFGYPYTLQRALHVAMRLFRGDPPAPDPVALHGPDAQLDDEQGQAVSAGLGVVQVIAPAGSGKTTVLIERVRELLRRGVPAQRILCTTFNRAASVELQQRLAAAGVTSVQARTFHSLGRSILEEERMLRRNGVTGRALSLAQWNRLCAQAASRGGTRLEARDARDAVSDIKLGMLCTPDEFKARRHERRDGDTLLAIYEAYERHLRERQINDFDDLIVLAVRALRDDADLRERWQARFDQVLVDEYQDIEPAQEILVRTLAAPGDGYFCCGDEDQTLYGWRRASVRRMVDLDLAYPGLQRVSLAHNYRCPPQVVEASRRLIEHNTIRFPKDIHPAPGRGEDPAEHIQLQQPASQAAGAARIADVLAGHQRGEVVVLARTTNLLRTVALACVDQNVMISAPPAVFEPRGAREALEAYLRICSRPDQATGEDVIRVCRSPNRSLPYESEEQVAQLLRDGFTFAQTFDSLRVESWQRTKLDQAARILDQLRLMTDATKFIRYLRTAGGLDRHFEEYEDAFGDTEKIESEVLDQAEKEAAGMTVAQYSELLTQRTDALRAIRDDEQGVELATIHGAKGRQWPRVELFGCEEKQLPHAKALKATPAQQAVGEGLQAERRLAYVAFTRAQNILSITLTDGSASRFLTEAGLTPNKPYRAPEEPDPRRAGGQRPGQREGLRATTRGRAGATSRKSMRQPARASQPTPKTPVEQVIDEARRVGLSYALRTCADRNTALSAAADAIDRRLIGAATTSENLTIEGLLEAIEQLDSGDRQRILASAQINAPKRLVARANIAVTRRLSRALRAAGE